MTKFEWGLLIVAVILVAVAVNSYGHMGDSLSPYISAQNQPTSNQNNDIYKATAGFNPTTNRVGFNLSGGVKL